VAKAFPQFLAKLWVLGSKCNFRAYSVHCSEEAILLELRDENQLAVFVKPFVILVEVCSIEETPA
jgi:hypothetical protein